MFSSSKAYKYVSLVTDNFGFIYDENNEQIAIKRFTWKNANRIQVQLITYGATVISVKYPNKKGIVDDVLLGFDDVKSYMNNDIYLFGSTIGRYANYIKNSTFNLLNKQYTVTSNFGKHYYNGGDNSFNKIIWNHFVSGKKVILSHLSPNDDDGFPGDLLVFAQFELSPTNEFQIEYKAMSTKHTIVNIVNHCYFNLNGHSSGEEEICKHTISINADCHTLTDNDMIPTGEVKSVINTIYDFQIPANIGKLIDRLNGLDNNFCINRGTDHGVGFVARLHHPPSGRVLEVYSNQNGVQFETGNYFPEKLERDCTKSSVKFAKCPYIKARVSSFDMLDEIHNNVIAAKSYENSYSDLIALIQDLQKKEKPLFRTSSRIDQKNSFIKRASVTLETLPLANLTLTQIKYIDRIIKEINKMEQPNSLSTLKSILGTAIFHTKDQFTESRSLDVTEIGRTKKIGIRGKNGAKYSKHGGVCLQCQNYPDAPNKSSFPNCILKPGAVYNHTIIYKFLIKTDQSGITGEF